MPNPVDSRPEPLDGHGGGSRPAASGPPLPEIMKALQAGGALPPDVLEAWQRGDKLEAFKRFATAAKEGRVQAKVNVKMNTRDADHGIGPGASRAAPKPAPHAMSPADMLGPGEVPRTRLAPASIVILVVAIVVLIWIFRTLA